MKRIDLIKYELFVGSKFRDYVVVHNKQDRDDGELNEIPDEEFLRLFDEFYREKSK